MDNAVARTLLETVQSRLPRWTGRSPDGDVVTTRRRRKIQPRRNQLLPQLLFSVNWADSGPGFSWPEAYFVTYVPDFDIRIVIASADSDELWGYADLAIGWCRALRSADWGSRTILMRWWWRLSREMGNGPWDEFQESGVVNEKRARAWRDGIWGRSWSA